MRTLFKNLIKPRYLTTFLFLLFLAIFFLLSLKPFAREAWYAFSAGALPQQVETGYNADLPARTGFITLNGGFQRLIGKREVNERYRLDNGQLTYVIPALDMTAIAENTAAFARTLEEKNIPFLYVNTPFKIQPDDKQLPVSIEDYSNENADAFLQLLRSFGVDTLDLRELEQAEGLEHYDLFFPTDHHWTPETGLWAVRQITDALGSRNPVLAVDPALTDPDSYSVAVQEGIYLGSHGRRVGPWYAGMDDLSLITPTFPTSLRFSVPSEGLAKEGCFEESVLFPEMLTEGSLLESSRYDVYCGGEYPLMRIENLSGGNGHRLLVLKDSFSLVVAPFLSLGFEIVDYVDLRLFGDGLLDLIQETNPDYVIVLYNPGALEDNNTVMFDFLRR